MVVLGIDIDPIVSNIDPELVTFTLDTHDVITSTDLNERLALVMSNSEIPNTPENQQHITPRIVQSLIDEALELQEAKHQSITIPDADIDKMLDDGDLTTGVFKKSTTAGTYTYTVQN